MSYEILDYYFPFLVLIYGMVLLFVLSNPYLTALGDRYLEPNIWRQFKAHKMLGWICVFVGLFWSLQNLFVST